MTTEQLKLCGRRVRKQPSGCWDLPLAGNAKGYVYLTLGGRDGTKQRAHRVAYCTWVGAIPEGQQVLHRCDNRRCINPEHLFLGSGADNTADMMQKNRWSNQYARGVR